jgi:O-antigen/teichoic acid export membrane protein
MMLLNHTVIYLAANAFAAAFGLLNVVLFTRYFGSGDYGIYVLGFGFANIASSLLGSWLRLPIAREQARGDGTDIRGYLLRGFALSCAVAPATFLAAHLVGLGYQAATTAVIFALTIIYFDLTQELLRARLKAFSVMKATMLRAVLVPLLGVAFTALGTSGLLLLASSALAYALSALVFTRDAWAGVVLRIQRARLWHMARAGLPLTVSITLLAISSVADRLIVAYFAGAAETGKYSAGADLVRQALTMPAVSAAAAFFPIAVQTLANRGGEAARRHLDECLELLVAITLPAALGIAVTSAHIANIVLGPEFRSLAAQIMPIISMAVVFQVLTYQYLHISFLLSERNSFYLLNTGAAVVFGVIVASCLTAAFGAIGTAWGRLAADVFGFLVAVLLTRWAFPLPWKPGKLVRVIGAAMVMALIVKGFDMFVSKSDSLALAVLIPVGIASYGALCLLLDICRARDGARHLVEVTRNFFRAPSREIGGGSA